MGDRRKCQTYTASPAEPGDLPVMLGGCSMPTKRMPINRYSKPKFTPEILAAYKRARDNDDGDAAHKLHILLRRMPWQADIMFVNADGSPPEFTRSEEAWHVEDRKQALEIRHALEQASK